MTPAQMTSAQAGPAAARTVIVMRHAHAASSASSGDHARSLDERGRREAVDAGRWLAGLDLGIELVLCSPATRARQTWAGAALAWDGRPDDDGPDDDGPRVSVEARLYDGGVDDLIQLINDASAHTLVLVGHNPSVSDLVSELDPDFAREMRPASVAVIELADESGAAGGRVTDYWTPQPG